MKTQLIQLDPYDDVISVRDKMGWSQTSRILLIWPEQGKILSRSLDLVLLQRHSASLGAQLALVTTDPQVREIAPTLGLPVFRNTRQAQKTHWRGKRRRRERLPRFTTPPDLSALRQQIHSAKGNWQEQSAARFGLFGISVLAILALAWILLPSARITILPRTRQQSVILPVTASLRFTSVNLVGSLPAETLSVIVEGRDSLLATGSMQIPADSAVSAVLFTNLTEHSINIPVGLIVSTLDANPIRFTTTSAGRLREGPGRTLTLSATALVPGEVGNLPSGSLVAVEGEYGLSLAATNPYPSRGGSDAPSPAPSQSDRTRLFDNLVTSLYKTALTDLQDSLPEGGYMITTTLELSEVLEETFTPEIGLPGDQVDLTLRLEFTTQYISEANLQSLVIPLMDGSLPEGYVPLPETLSVTHTLPSTPNRDGIVNWTLTADRQVQAEIAPSEVIQLAVGQPSATIIHRLAAILPLESLPELALTPSWWPRLPFLSFRIEVVSR